MLLQRTELFPDKYPFQLNYSDKMLFLGSCFSDTIAGKLKDNKFQVLSNPMGIIYNPHSLAQWLKWAVTLEVPQLHFVDKMGQKVALEGHSTLSASSSCDLEESYAAIIHRLHRLLPQLKLVAITFGTGYAYYHKKSRIYVANCHQLPQNEFEKRLLKPGQIAQDWIPLISEMKKLNPSVIFLFTLSPVKHLRDGISENFLSKSYLRTAIQLIQEETQSYYFPSYELLSEDLRDYRYYKEDMAHPSTEAENYIFQKFLMSCFSSSALELLSKWQKIEKELLHLPRNPNSSENIQRLKKLYSSMDELKQELPLALELENLELKIANLENN